MQRFIQYNGEDQNKVAEKYDHVAERCKQKYRSDTFRREIKAS